jgi:hydrogenase-4 component B
LLSMVGALSVASFAKAFGLGFLGRPRSKSAELAHEPSSGTVCAQVLLSIPCLALGVLAPAVLRLLEPVGSAIVPGYNSAGIFTLPQPQLMLAMAGLTVLIYALVLSGNNARVKRYVTWDCGYGPLPVRTLINPSSYSLPLANLFRPILQHKITSQITGRDRRHFPDSIKIEEENIPLLTKLVYMPAVRTIEAASRGLIRLQTGSIHVHLLYVFATLLALAVIGTHL